LQLAGSLSAIFASVRLMLIAIRRMRTPHHAPQIAVTPPPSSRTPLPHFPAVKPRAHFGLRDKKN
jgi:hypothetical protein